MVIESRARKLSVGHLIRADCRFGGTTEGSTPLGVVDGSFREVPSVGDRQESCRRLTSPRESCGTCVILGRKDARRDAGSRLRVSGLAMSDTRPD
jgi:hypothetical protein